MNEQPQENNSYMAEVTSFIALSVKSSQYISPNFYLRWWSQCRAPTFSLMTNNMTQHSDSAYWSVIVVKCPAVSLYIMFCQVSFFRMPIWLLSFWWMSLSRMVYEVWQKNSKHQWHFIMLIVYVVLLFWVSLFTYCCSEWCFAECH